MKSRMIKLVQLLRVLAFLAIPCAVQESWAIGTLQLFLNGSGNVQSWNGVGGAVFNADQRFTIFGGFEHYVAGSFDQVQLFNQFGQLIVGSTSASNIAYVKRVNFQTPEYTINALGSGTDGVINALAFFDGKLYMGGDFATAGGSTSNENFAAYNINTYSWVAMTSSVLGYDGYNRVTGITVQGDHLVVAVNSGGTGAVADSIYGMSAVPWNTAFIDWYASSGTGYWTNWR